MIGEKKTNNNMTPNKQKKSIGEIEEKKRCMYGN
jgi:hypothetical protein